MREASATYVAAAGAMKPSTAWRLPWRASRRRCQITSWWAMRLRNWCIRLTGCFTVARARGTSPWARGAVLAGVCDALAGMVPS